MIGTLVNTGTVILGSLLGLMIHARLPQKMINIVFQGIGLVTLGIGISMSLESKSLILSVVSVVVGAVLGQWLDLDARLRRFSLRLQQVKRGVKTKDEVGVEATTASERFTEGFMTASMLFCVGSMAILGAIEEGMGGAPNLLLTKALMDGVAAVAFASTFGIGVLFSAFPVLIYQGGLTLAAGLLMQYMSPAMTSNLTGVGGILLLGLGLNILKIKEINVTNMLPSLVIIVLLSYFFA